MILDYKNDEDYVDDNNEEYKDDDDYIYESDDSENYRKRKVRFHEQNEIINEREEEEYKEDLVLNDIQEDNNLNKSSLLGIKLLNRMVFEETKYSCYEH